MVEAPPVEETMVEPPPVEVKKAARTTQKLLKPHFVEMDPWVVKEVLTPNLEWTGFLDVSVIHRTRVEELLKQVAQSQDQDRCFDYVSVTPPYTAVDYSMLLTQLGNSPLVGEDCFIVSSIFFVVEKFTLYYHHL